MTYLSVERRPARHPHALTLIFGLALTASYGVFAAVAAMYYPTAYSPLHNNTLSQLGNSNLNPHGAGYYLIGCALSGLFTMAFFVSVASWRATGTVAQNRMLLLVQALGVAGGFGLVMNAVYPENQMTLHHFWAGVVFNALGAAMLLSPLAFWRRGHPNLRLAGMTLLGTAAVLLMYTFARTHWLEWLPVGLFLLAPPLLGLHGRAIVSPSPLVTER